MESNYAPVNEEQTPFMNQQGKQYKPDRFRYLGLTSRICNLVLFVLISSSSDLSFYGFSLVATQIQDIFKVSPSLQYWYASAYLVSTSLFSIPASFIIGSCSVKISLAVGVSLSLIGMWLRVGIESSFYFAFVGQYILGIAYSFFRNSITSISAHWFSTNKRALSTTLLITANTVSSNLSLFLPTLAIDVNTILPGQQAYYRKRISSFFLIYAIVSSIISLLALTFYRNSPKIPISISSEVIRIKPKHSFKAFCTNPSAVLLTLNQTFAVSTAIVYAVIMQSAFASYGANTSSLNSYVLISIPSCILIVIPISILAGKIGKFKVFLVGFSFLGFIALGSVLVFIKAKSTYPMGICFIILFSMQALELALGLEVLSQIAYPICILSQILAESFSMGVVMFSVKIMSIAILQISSFLIVHGFTLEAIALITFLQLIASLFLLPVKETLIRRNQDIPDRLQQ